jgi:tellurite resistance protein
MQAADVTAPAAARPASATTLAWLPVGLFGAVMGLTGLALAWRLAHRAFGTPAVIGQAIGVLASVAFVVLADVSLPLARLAWVLGAAGMTLLAWTIILRWLSVRHTPAQIAPAWIVPVVGMLDIPLAVPVLRWDGLHGVMTFGLAVGLFFALPLIALLLARLVTEEALPVALQPSLLILVAPFRLAWWAGSFPLAASAVAALRYAAVVLDPVMDAIAMVVLGMATLVVGMLGVWIVRGIVRGRLRELS